MAEFVCPIANDCVLMRPGSPECGTVGEHFPALPTAEQMCINALARQVDYERTNPNEWTQRGRNLRHAWALVELARRLPPGDPRAADSFEDVRILVDRVVDESIGDAQAGGPHTDSERYVDATLLDIYVPSFMAMHAGKSLQPRQRTAIRAGIANLMDRVDESARHESIRRGMRSKLGLHLLFERSSLSILPASAREGHSRTHVRDNHDAWIPSDDGKISIKMRGLRRRKEEYGKQVLFLSANELACQGYRKAYDREPQAGILAIETAVRLLCREAQGEHLEMLELRWLDGMTQIATNKVRNFAAALPPKQ